MTNKKVRRAARGLVIAASAALSMFASQSALAKAPEIRTSPENPMPACVTPAKLMAFLKSRNGRLDPRFKDIAAHYKTYGDAWRVRWDYAFFQMAIETNFLTYRQPNGRMGDVDPAQNNFAGIGTTGGGVPGNSFPDVKTGVHAQIQHLVVYSGERLAAPIAERTQLKQDEILTKSLSLNRPVRFGDLARRWAVDPAYDKSIEWVADLYRKRYCTGRQAAEAPETAPAAPFVVAGADAPEPRLAAAPKPAQRHPAVRTVWVRSEPGRPQLVIPQSPQSAPVIASNAAATADVVAAPAATAQSIEPTAEMLPIASPAETQSTAEVPPAPAAPAKPAFDPAKTPPSGLGAIGLACSIGTASYGGAKTVLIKAPDGDKARYTALTVLAGFETSMTASYIKARAPGGQSIGEFASRDEAITKANELCSAGK